MAYRKRGQLREPFGHLHQLLINCPGVGMIFNIVGVSLFYKAGGHGRGGDGHDEDDHMILSGVFMDTVADTLASLVVLVSALGRHIDSKPYQSTNILVVF